MASAVELGDITEKRCCLICNDGALSTSSFTCVSPPPLLQQQSLLTKHLEIILLLKNVFELPSEQLTEFLSNHPNIEEWISVCETCEQLVHQFKSLHEQMISLKMKIIRTMKASLRMDYTDKQRKGNDQSGPVEGQILNVADTCRRFVVKYEYGPNHFKHVPNQVKQEINKDIDTITPQNIEDDDDNHLPASPSSPYLEMKPEDLDSDADFEIKDRMTSPTRKSTRITLATAGASAHFTELHCPKCDKSFLTKDILNSHIITDHIYLPDVASRTCTTCNMLFFDKPTCERHLIRKHGYRRQPKIDYGTQTKCDECSKIFKTPRLLYHHTKQVHENNLDHLCDLCGKKLTCKLSLDKHRKICGTRRLEDGSVKKRTKCPVEGCKIYYIRDDLLEKHVEEHRKPPTWKCSQCSEKFHFKKLLQRHELVEHGIGFICEHCGKIFHVELNLRSHKKTSLKCKLIHQTKVEATVKCEKCGKLCASRESLKRHVNAVHELKFDWKCEHCGHGYMDRNLLLFHLKKTHGLGEYKWKCPLEGCDKGFAFEKNLNGHIAMHEGVKGEKCEECGKGFDSVQRLKSHKRKVHGEKVNCEICGRQFKSQVYLNFHLKNSHKVKKRNM